MKLPRILIIAGTDSGGGAGIPADIKAVAAMGGHALCVVSAVTAQNTLGVQAVHEIPLEMIHQQFFSVISDIGVDAVKTGMLASPEVIELTAQLLQNISQPIVVDPVMVAKGGHRLMIPQAETALRQLLLPMARVITPNLDEAEVLVGYPVRERGAMIKAAHQLCAWGAGAALIKGGHMSGDTILDILYDGQDLFEFSSPRIDTPRTHGTGCTLASSLAALLGSGWELPAAVERARQLVLKAIHNSLEIGNGHGPVHALADLDLLLSRN